MAKAKAILEGKDFGQLLQVYQNNVDAARVKEVGKIAKEDKQAAFVASRFYKMAYAKNKIRQIWDGVQQLYYANDWE